LSKTERSYHLPTPTVTSRASPQSTRRSTTSMEGSHVTPSLERWWCAVNVLPSSLRSEVQRVWVPQPRRPRLESLRARAMP